jgi:two-component system sensor histidine kinase/response regulator
VADMDENAELGVAEEGLLVGGDHFRRLVQALPIPVAYSDRRGVILTTNARFTQVLGYAGDDIPDVETWFRLAYPDPAYRAEVVTEWTAALSRAVQRRGEVDPIEARVTCKDGSQRVMLISAVLLGEDTLVAFQARRLEDPRRRRRPRDQQSAGRPDVEHGDGPGGGRSVSRGARR